MTPPGRFPPSLVAATALALAVPLVFVIGAPWQIGDRNAERLTIAFSPAVITILGCIALRSWRAPMRRALRARWIFPGATAVVLFLCAEGFFLRGVVGLFRALEVNAWDFSAFELPITRSLTDGFLYSPIDGRSFLGTHASYLLAAFILPYSIVKTPYWLLAAHATAISAAVATAYLLFRRLLRDDASALLFAVALALNSYTAKVAQYPFHIEVFYPFFVVVLCLGLRTRKPVLAASGFLLLSAVKEDALLLALGLTLMLTLARPRRLMAGAAVLAAGTALYLLSTRYVMPAAAHTAPGHAWYSGYWRGYGPTPNAAAAALVTHPLRVFTDLSRSGVANLLGTFLFLPLLGFDWLLLALPALIVYGVAGGGLGQISHFSIYYSAPVLAVLAIAAAKGARRVAVCIARRAREARLARSRLVLRLLATATLLACALDGPGYVFRAPKPERLDVLTAVSLARPGVDVLVQGSLFPHAGYSMRLFPLSKLAATGREAFLVDPNSNPYPFSSGELTAFVDRTARDPRYALHRTPRGLVLLNPVSQPDGRPNGAAAETGAPAGRTLRAATPPPGSGRP